MLELDIDQLSIAAIQKLWDLCAKSVPGFGRGDNGLAADTSMNSPPMDQAALPRSARPKKNKPMNAREQEERISKLKGIRDQFRSGGLSGSSPRAANDSITALTPSAMHDDHSSDSSDSEEE